MTPEEIILEFIRTVPFVLIKPFALILLFLHIFLSIVIVRQTKLMIKVVEAKISPTIYAIAVVHLFSSFALFLWALIFL